MIKEDFVTFTVTINQKRDKFAGVMFGIYTNDSRMNKWFAQKGIDITKPLQAKYCKESFDYLISGKLGYEESLNV